MLELTLLMLSAILPLRICGGSSEEMDADADTGSDWESEWDGAFGRDFWYFDEVGVDEAGALGGGGGRVPEFMLVDEVLSLLRRDSLYEREECSRGVPGET